VTRAQIRVLIAVRERLASGALAAALKAAGFAVVAELHDVGSAVERIEAEAADVAVVSVDLLRLDRSGAFERLIRAEEVPLLLVSFGAQSPDLDFARRVGASGFLSKSSTPDQLIEAIRTLEVGGSYLPPDVPDSDIVRAASQPGRARKGISALTHREREVLALLAEGMSAREIAAACRISVRTVDTHRRNLMRKLDARKLSDLVRIAIREGIVEA
jgi:DNA-binding NarL/FixJ family response regulator